MLFIFILYYFSKMSWWPSITLPLGYVLFCISTIFKGNNNMLLRLLLYEKYTKGWRFPIEHIYQTSPRYVLKINLISYKHTWWKNPHHELQIKFFLKIEKKTKKNISLYHCKMNRKLQIHFKLTKLEIKLLYPKIWDKWRNFFNVYFT